MKNGLWANVRIFLKHSALNDILFIKLNMPCIQKFSPNLFDTTKPFYSRNSTFFLATSFYWEVTFVAEMDVRPIVYRRIARRCKPHQNFDLAKKRRWNTFLYSNPPPRAELDWKSKIQILPYPLNPFFGSMWSPVG